MKKTLVGIGLFLLASSMPLHAQLSLVNPIPHSATGGTVFNLPSSWQVVCEKELDTSVARKALRQTGVREDAKASYTVTLALATKGKGKKLAKKVPAKAEGYYLKVSEKEVTIVGRDTQGLYYGVRTLLEMAAQGKLEVSTVTDWPDVPYRGVVEGFYGTPWSHEARLSQLDFYGKHKMNVYIYGPKDDPYHRDHWRVPYPEKEGQLIKELAQHAKENGVSFYWAIHPGVDIKWNDADRDALVAKFEQMYNLGVRAFAVFFDDIWGEGTKADKQAELLNYVDDNFISKKHDVVPLVLCPTEYNRSWANEEKGYLRTLGKQLHKSIEIMWTGNSVVHCIDKESMKWINERIDRRAYIWWNYPVSDFVRDRILLGPAYGNGLDIAEDVSGFVSNPMEHAEASKIALYGIADYTWNMSRYDYQADWEKALREVLPSAPEALRTFALYNKDLGPNGHGFRREEGDELLEIKKQLENNNILGIQQLLVKAIDLNNAADVLLADKTNPRLIHELRPWLLQAKNVAAYVTDVCFMASSVEGNGSVSSKIMPSFDRLYKQALSIKEQMFELENSDVRHPFQPGCKLAGKVMLPMTNDLFARTVNKYNAKHGTDYKASSDYVPYKLTSGVPQLAQLPVGLQGQRVSVNPSNEVIKWPAGAALTIESEREFVLQGMEFNFGVNGAAKNFKLEVFDGKEWKEVSILHYKDNDPVIHTGNELSGMKATRLRVVNKTDKEQEVYFRSFRFDIQ